MQFELTRALEILQNTPSTLRSLLSGLSEDWTSVNEGGESWSVYDIIGHLIHGEKTDWVPRMEIILSEGDDKLFQPFDRFAQFEASKGKTLAQLLDEFSMLRTQNLEILRLKNLSKDYFNKNGIHPAFGEVTLSQLLATWVVHDLNHISQIARVLAHQYKEEVGPWVAYLKVLQS